MNNNINLNLYKVFYFVATTKSFKQASIDLCVSQPAISTQIKNLEGLTNYVKCSYIIDKDNLLDLKMSPFDNGYDVLKILLDDRIKIN